MLTVFKGYYRVRVEMTSLDPSGQEEPRFHKSFNISFAGTFASHFLIEEDAL
jgi:hypothetical protein